METEHPIFQSILIFISRSRIKLLFILILVISAPLFAQADLKANKKLFSGEAPLLRFENLGLKDGLVQGTVYDIMQDSEGFLWITSQGGLHRYNGYEFKVYENIPFDSTSISANHTYLTEEAANGDIWVTTFNGGLNRLDRDSDTFIQYFHDKNDISSISSNEVWDVLESKNGDLWVSTVEGLNRMPAG
ncbi:MAG TPA: two-component regulator propeller domain-containing protein, partial [Salinimicrobium sp.]|nr:two-component regulator propeller domain-containing protein [Salinimicrobium sp.]